MGDEMRRMGVLQQLHCNLGAGFGVGEGVVVVFHRTTAGGGHGVQLVVGQAAAEVAARSPAGAKELVVGVVHLIDAEHGPEAAFVKGTVVRHERQPFNQRLDLSPHDGEYGRVVGVLVREAVHALAKPCVVVRLGLDERIERVGDDAAAHHHHTHAAYAAALPVGGLEVYGCKVGHNKLADTSFFYAAKIRFLDDNWENLGEL